jgi:hypothetical protein
MKGKLYRSLLNDNCSMKSWITSILTLFFIVSAVKTYGINSTIYHYTYKHLYGLTWQVTANVYVNCDYYGNFVTVSSYAFHDTCNFKTKGIAYAYRVDTLSNGSPYLSNCYFNNCPSTLTMCDSPFNATGLVAWRQVTYLDTITLPEPCGLWKFSRGAISSGNVRDPMVTNITPNTYTYYYEAILHADSTQPNSSALWQRPMFMYAYENEPTHWHLPITDPDGDSLVYSHVPPRKRDMQSPNPLDTLIFDIPFISPYTLNTEPFNTYETWRFKPQWPSIQFTAAPNQLALVCFKVEEYRQGVYMGATFRDVLIKTIPPVHQVPRRKIDTLGLQQVTLSGEDTVIIYTGQAMNLCSKYYSSTGAVLKHESNIPSLLNGATYSASYVGNTDTVLTCLQWTPALADTGVYLAVTTLTDTSCVVTGPKVPQDYFHRIIVKKNPVGVNNKTKEKWYTLYPNPTQSSIYVNMPLRCKYEIYDAVGRILVRGESGQTTQTHIDVSAFQNGVYTLHFADQSLKFSVVR